MRPLLGLTLLLCAGVALAHGPTRQKVTESVKIDAPPAVVWNRIKDFAALHTWHPAIESSATTDGNNVGSVRTLKLKGGGTIVEILEGYSDAERKYRYRMTDPGPVPVSNYTSTITVTEGENGGSVVEWRGAFYRGYPNNDPPPERNDEAAIAAVTGIYRAGLDNLPKLIVK
jgi:uncharacterized protein YndB with AHSA1/START domain